MPKKTKGVMTDREKKMFLNMGGDILTGKKKIPKGRISDRDIQVFLATEPKKRNKPKWKDRSAYPPRGR